MFQTVFVPTVWCPPITNHIIWSDENKSHHPAVQMIFFSGGTSTRKNWWQVDSTAVEYTPLLRIWMICLSTECDQSSEMQMATMHWPSRDLPVPLPLLCSSRRSMYSTSCSAALCDAMLCKMPSYRCCEREVSVIFRRKPHTLGSFPIAIPPPWASQGPTNKRPWTRPLKSPTGKKKQISSVLSSVWHGLAHIVVEFRWNPRN